MIINDVYKEMKEHNNMDACMGGEPLAEALRKDVLMRGVLCTTPPS